MADRSREVAGACRLVGQMTTTDLRTWTDFRRDGENWTRHRDTFLDRNHTGGTWDHAMAWGGDCVTAGDRELFYYGGYSTSHKVGDRQIGVAVLRKDGFVSRDGGPDGACLRTRPFVLDGRELRVNADVRGELRVRIVDQSGLPIGGYFWSDCAPIRGDSTAHRIRWSSRELGALAGTPIALEFRLCRASLYASELAP